MLQVFAKTFALTLARASSLCQTTRNIAPMPRSKTVASSRLRENGSALSVSQKFLAEHLGLSPATVSLVINRSPAAKSIPHRTQERIRQAARELNYRPNFVARSLRALREAGCRVPEDVSVVGFDDIQSAAFQNPALTTVRQPLRAMGVIAAETLLRRINAPAKSPYPKSITVEPELIVRASTASAGQFL